MVFVAKMITKFNQEMYVKLRARRNEPLFSIGQKRPRVTKESSRQLRPLRLLSNPRRLFLLFPSKRSLLVQREHMAAIKEKAKLTLVSRMMQQLL